MLSAVLARGLSKPEETIVGEVNEARRQYLGQKYGVAVTGDNRQAAEKGDVVVLAIKPQTLAEVMAGLKGCFRPAQVVLSIIAGARISTICSGLGHRRVVRAMPNMPAQIGQGISVWTTTTEVTKRQRERAGSVLGVTGLEIYVDDEKYLDMATAVSGSGPAYFFLFAECLIEAAVQIGLAKEVAERLVLETMRGSAELVCQSGNPAELRRKVTSPGGTTAAALAQFDQAGFDQTVIRAVRAAYERARELGG